MSKRGRDEDVARAIARVRGCSGADEAAAATTTTTLTPLERQVVALKTRLPPHVLLLVACGYRVKAYGRDAHVISRRCGVACIRARPFAYCSVPYTRIDVYVHRLVAMGYHVAFADQESSVLRASVGVKSGLFARTLSRLYSRGTLLPSEAVVTAGSTAATAVSAANAARAVVASASSSSPRGRSAGVASRADAHKDDDNDDDDGDGDGGDDETGADNDDHGDADAPLPQPSSHDTAAHSELYMCFLASVIDDDAKAATTAAATCVHAVLVSFVTRRRVSFVLHSALALEDVLQRYDIVEVVVLRVPSHNDNNNKDDDGRDGDADARWPSPTACLRALPESFATVLHHTLPLHHGPTHVGAEDDKSVSVCGSYGAYDAPPLQPHKAASSSSAMRDNADIADYLTPYGLRDAYMQLCRAPDDDGDTTRNRSRHDAHALAHSDDGDDGECAVLQLPGSTLRALDVFQTSSGSSSSGGGDGGGGGRGSKTTATAGSLLSLLDHTVTACGARRLRDWLAAPLAQRRAVVARQDAVTYLLRGGDGGAAEALLRDCARAGDVDATLSKLHAQTCSVVEFARLLACVRATATRAREWLATAAAADRKASDNDNDDKSVYMPALLQSRLRRVSDAAVARFLRAHTTDLAGATTPLELFARDTNNNNNNDNNNNDNDNDERTCDDEERGAVAEMRRHAAARDAAAAALAAELTRVRHVLHLPGLDYRTIAATTWVLDVPAAKASSVPADWLVLSRTRSHVRYHTPVIRAQNTALCAANEQLAAAAARAWRARQAALTRDAADAAVLRAAVDVVADVDALRSLARASARSGYVAPVLFDVRDNNDNDDNNNDNNNDDDAAMLCVRDGRHPMLDVLLPHGYVSCDVRLAVGGAWLLTGPNMGGKSALMRMVGLLVVLAQLGCYVPARAARLPVFAGVHCRMGASDSILEGRSTFLSEMDETARLLRVCHLSRALVLMDELGRGTSSFDGAAVAAATLEYLVQHGATTLFVTHYNFLCTPYCSSNNDDNNDNDNNSHSDDDDTTPSTRRVACYYMGFRERSATTRTDEATALPDTPATRAPSLVFTYQPCRGVTPSSFGVAIAEMAGLPSRVTDEARRRSQLAEAASSLRADVAQLRRVLRT